MTRKDYKLLAASFARTKPLADNTAALAQWKADVTNLAGCLARDNSRFDCVRFLIACDLTADTAVIVEMHKAVNHG